MKRYNEYKDPPFQDAQGRIVLYRTPGDRWQVGLPRDAEFAQTAKGQEFAEWFFVVPASEEQAGVAVSKQDKP